MDWMGWDGIYIPRVLYIEVVVRMCIYGQLRMEWLNSC